MSELHDLLERRAGDYHPPADLLPRVHERARRRERNRRTGSALAGLLIVAVAAGGIFRMLQPTTAVVFDPPANLWSGTWVSTDLDGSSQTMEIRGLDGGTYEVVVADDAATVCAGGPSTMSGTGQFDESGLVLPAPVLTCDDGSTPQTTDGSLLAEALRDYTLVRNTDADTLSDNLGVTWSRPRPTPDVETTEAPIQAPMWPQSSLDEVREAQERADAGDPAYTWQVEPAMDDVGGDAEIFTRFLTEELGWEEFRWGAEASWSASMYWDQSDGSSSIDFVRCATGELNPLYPKDPEGRRCPPTLDEYAYETVRLTAYQPLADGPDGIWVIQSSQRPESVRQFDPLTDSEIARAVEPLLKARVEGKGAAGIAGHVPLLYATSNGAGYERFDYEVVDGPKWPFGDVDLNVLLFADGGQTVVEQPFSVALDLESVVTPAPPDRLTMLNYERGERPTTENGTPIPEPYDLFDGRLTFAADWSWSDGFVAPHGPDTTGLYRGQEHEQVFAVVGDPLTPTATCDVGDRPPSADAFVRSLRSRPNLSVSAPRPARVGSIDAVQLDVTADDESDGCVVPPGADEQPNEGAAVLAPRPDMKNHPEARLWWGVGRNNRARLYVFDVAGNPARTVAILVMAPEPDFQGALAAAQPILDSFEVHPE